MIDALVKVGGERLLSYSDVGDRDGACVFFFHGAPASRLQLVDLDGALAARGLRVVSPDRPGYGMSAPQPGRSYADWPADVAALADALSIERFVVAGHSSGGPYAVACAALLPDRVSAALVIAGVTDMGWPGAWEGFLESEAALMRIRDARAGVAWCVEQFGADGSRFGDAAGFALPAPDEDFLGEPANAGAMAANLEEAFRQGVVGYAQDILLQGAPWPFDPGQIRVLVDVVHGDSDTVVPVAHSRHTAERIPGAMFRPLPGHGHLSVLSEIPELASALVASHRPIDPSG